MKRLWEQKTRRRVPVEVVPFAEAYVSDGLSTPGAEPLADFVYIASGEAHKNHERLLEAWELMVFEGLVPSLRLTLDERRYSRCAVNYEIYVPKKLADIERPAIQ